MEEKSREQSEAAPLGNAGSAASSIANNPTAQAQSLSVPLKSGSTPPSVLGEVLVLTPCVMCEPVGNVQSSSNTIWPYAPSLISAALVITGWLVVNKAQANRERRKQVREFVSGLMKDLAELERLVIAYHTSERNLASEQAIISKLTRFERGCVLVPRFVTSQWFLKAVRPMDLNIPPIVIQGMRKAMTLRHFSDEHTEPVEVFDPLVQGIEVATVQVQEALECVQLGALD